MTDVRSSPSGPLISVSGGGGGGSDNPVYERNTSAAVGHSYTPLLSEADGYFRITDLVACFFNVPAQAAVPFEDNTILLVVQAGAGPLSITGDPGVVINTPRTYAAIAQYSVLALKRVSANVWDLSGDLQA